MNGILERNEVTVMEKYIQVILYNEELSLTQEEWMMNTANAQQTVASVMATKYSTTYNIPYYLEWLTEGTPKEIQGATPTQLIALVEEDFEEAYDISFSLGQTRTSAGELAVLALPPFKRELKEKYVPFLPSSTPK